MTVRSDYLLEAFMISSPVLDSLMFSKGRTMTERFPTYLSCICCSPVWVLCCLMRLECWLKAFPQSWHSWGFSPVCIRLQFPRSDLCKMPFPHKKILKWLLFCVSHLVSSEAEASLRLSHIHIIYLWCEFHCVSRAYLFTGWPKVSFLCELTNVETQQIYE